MAVACLDREPIVAAGPDHRESVAARRVLLISYHFPPVGGAGVQRPAKFVKYLRDFGWEPTVLMASNPSAPVIDESLCHDLPENLQILKARTLEPSYAAKQQLIANTTSKRLNPLRAIRGVARGLAGLLLQPDPQILWLPAAYQAAAALLNREPHAVILATAPAYTNLLLGGLLKQRFKIPLVCDFRDEWDLSSEYLENRSRDGLTRLVQQKMQNWVLHRTDAIVATTAVSTQRLLERARQVRSQATADCIYNGYDDSDFANSPVESHVLPRDSQRYRLVYTGTLWNLTTVAPLVEAIERLQRESPALLEKLELVFVGRKTPAQQQLLQRVTSTGCLLRESDYCDHHDAVSLMRTADGLCLLLSDLPGADRVAPAKLFEYLAAGRPVLGITPSGETAGLVREFFPHGQFVPQDVSGIANWLRGQILKAGSSCGAKGAERFSRRALTGRLAAVLDQFQ